MKRFIEQEAKEKAEEILIKVRSSSLDISASDHGLAICRVKESYVVS